MQQSVNIVPERFDFHKQHSQYSIVEDVTNDVANLKKKLLNRSRWDGVLNEFEVSYCRENNIPIGYDCVQIGWVVLSENAELSSVAPKSKSRHIDNIFNIQRVDDLIKSYTSALAMELEKLSDGNTAAALRQIAIDTSYQMISERMELTGLELDKLHHELLSSASNLINKFIQSSVSTDSTFVFRPWRDTDVDDYIKIVGNPKVWHYLPEDAPTNLSIDEAMSLIELSNLQDKHLVMAVELNSTVIGQVRILYSNHHSGINSAEITYILSEEYWGQGIMENILKQFSAEVISTLNLDLITAWIRPDHSRSAKVALRAGYVRDNFRDEAEVAKAVHRTGFLRYIYM